METSDEMKKHLSEHVQWPATGEEIMEACNKMDHVPEDERNMVMDKLGKEKTYQNMDKAMSDLKMDMEEEKVEKKEEEEEM